MELQEASCAGLKEEFGDSDASEFGVIGWAGDGLLDAGAAVGAEEHGGKAESFRGEFGPDTERCMATGTEGAQECAFGEHFGVGGGADQGLEELECVSVVGAAFDSESSLADSGEEIGWLEYERNSVLELESLESGFGEEDGVEFAVIEFFESGVDVAANFGRLEVGTKVPELGLPTGTAGADSGVCRKFFDVLDWCCSGRQEEHIAAGRAGRDAGEHESVCGLGGQVF
jgi:hypothetical protein